MINYVFPIIILKKPTNLLFRENGISVFLKAEETKMINLTVKLKMIYVDKIFRPMSSYMI